MSTPTLLNRTGQSAGMPAAALLLFASAAAVPLHDTSPWSTLWTMPAILAASLLITWGAESAQFFVAQGFALAILAWMQTLPEFAVEAVLAWKGQTTLLLANLTGALRLLTGLAWPMIYITAAVVHRRRTGEPMREIRLAEHHSVEVLALILPLLYVTLIWWKATLAVYDAAVLIAIYMGYLFVLSRLPAEEKEGIEDLDRIPRSIATAPRGWRIAGILGCFAAGGAIIYFVAEPFLGSLVSLATAIGIPSFVVIQWLAPVISEFPELLSTFYFARQEVKAPVALMNIASSNINQWTLLVAMLPIVLSMGAGKVTALEFDNEQQSELLLTISQSVAALTLLMNMSFAWWEALAMLLLFAAQFTVPYAFGKSATVWISMAFLAWAAVEIVRLFGRRRVPEAFRSFGEVWRAHMRA